MSTQKQHITYNALSRAAVSASNNATYGTANITAGTSGATTWSYSTGTQSKTYSDFIRRVYIDFLSKRDNNNSYIVMDYSNLNSYNNRLYKIAVDSDLKIDILTRIIDIENSTINSALIRELINIKIYFKKKVRNTWRYLKILKLRIVG